MPGDPSSQPPGRRAYKRYAARIWEDHKETIRELFVEQDKTHGEVAAILKDHHGLAVGARQLKRRTAEWGFVKNIPAKELAKMVRHRQRRQEQDGRPTRFQRDPGAGGYQVVSAAKLDAYQKRSGVSIDSMSDSSDLPSNIIAQTPSSYAGAGPHGVSPAMSARHSEFNAMTENIFSNTHSTVGESQMGSTHEPNRELEEFGEPLELLAATYAADGDYQSATQIHSRIYQICRTIRYRVMAQFDIRVMNAACYPGSPQSLAARIVDILSQSLVQAREAYSMANSEMVNEADLRSLLLHLRKNAEFWMNLLVQQRAVRIWEPILGPNHPKVAQLRHNIAEIRSDIIAADTDDTTILEKTREGMLDTPLEICQEPSLESVRDLLHLGDAPKDQLLEQLHAIESSSAFGDQCRLEVKNLRLGRSRALLGVYYSFIGQFSDAEKAFEDSERFVEHETCAEIKLHRTLWYAEHKTRIQDWDGALSLMHRAHEVFMNNETAFKFIIDHFPGRFKLLGSAVITRTSIDKVPNEAGIDDSPPDSYPLSPIPGTPVAAHSSPAAAAVSFLSPQRLFPPTPRGAHAKVDIEVWRQFVEYTPTGGTTASAGINWG
ncbi:hypothetical protein RB595_004446 [Gaeumannomyces hyphopodioides]